MAEMKQSFGRSVNKSLFVIIKDDCKEPKKELRHEKRDSHSPQYHSIHYQWGEEREQMRGIEVKKCQNNAW
jgi:hypothetical protein